VTIRLQGDAVVLRGFRETEVDAVAPRLGGDREAATRFVGESGTWTDRPTGLILAIEHDDRVVGELQVRGGRARILPPGVYELGIEIYDPADRGRGTGTDALVAVTAYLFDHEDAHRVQLSTAVDNVGMRGSAARAGFTPEGILRSFLAPPSHPEPADYVMYARTRGDHGG
jgi:RimJ/RimL family protein N-acetyltransferase